MTAHPHAFIAAPFFNPAEVEVVERIETEFERHGIPFFSARLRPPNPNADLSDPKIRREVNEMCKEGLRNSAFVLAWLDRVQDKGDEVMLVHNAWTRDVEHHSPPPHPEVLGGGIIKKRRMVKTDDGVIWEMGFADALQIPVIGFTLRPMEHLNAMLSENMMGLAHGWGALNELVRQCSEKGDWMQGVLGTLEAWGQR